MSPSPRRARPSSPRSTRPNGPRPSCSCATRMGACSTSRRSPAAGAQRPRQAPRPMRPRSMTGSRPRPLPVESRRTLGPRRPAEARRRRPPEPPGCRNCHSGVRGGRRRRGDGGRRGGGRGRRCGRWRHDHSRWRRGNRHADRRSAIERHTGHVDLADRPPADGPAEGKDPSSASRPWIDRGDRRHRGRPPARRYVGCRPVRARRGDARTVRLVRTRPRPPTRHRARAARKGRCCLRRATRPVLGPGPRRPAMDRHPGHVPGRRRARHLRHRHRLPRQGQPQHCRGSGREHRWLVPRVQRTWPPRRQPSPH